jgi:GABA(A) receptor-associated protein
MNTSYSNQPTLYAGSGAYAITQHDNNDNTSNLLHGASHVPNDHLERVKKSQFIMEKYPDRVPLIIQPSKNDRDAYPIDKSKYITPRDLTLLQLQQIIRRRIRFPPEKALFMFINNKIYPITSVIGTVYDNNKDSDGFLYITYCQENTFGSFY